MKPSEWGWPFGLVFLALFCIVMLRANGTYWVGRAIRRGGDQNRRLARLTGRPGYQRVEAALQRWGAPVVSLCFVTVGVQTMVNLAAGATRMPQKRYLPAVTIGSLLWALIYSTVGFIGFRALGLLWQRSPAATVVVAALMLLALIGFIVHGIVGRRSAEATDRPDQTSSADPADPARHQVSDLQWY